MSKKTGWTGERLETFVYNESTIEHLHRYAIACDITAGKTVLDIACGEGYGASLLAQKATAVTGVDIDTTVIAEAKQQYKRSNLQFIAGNAEAIPAADHSYDVVVSFETLEHLADHTAMLKEIKRVLKPGGLLLISTPDKKNYSDKRNYRNPYHLKELYREEFETLLRHHFKNVLLYEQQMSYASVITSGNRQTDHYSGDYTAISKNEQAEPLYLLALASDNSLPGLNNSLFNGQSIVEQALMEREKMVTGTLTYRLGHFLLYPFKLVRKLFKR